MLPDLQNLIVDRSPNELGVVQAGLAFQVVKLLDLLLRGLYLRHLLCHSVSSRIAHRLAVVWTVALIAKHMRMPQIGTRHGLRVSV